MGTQMLVHKKVNTPFFTLIFSIIFTMLLHCQVLKNTLSNVKYENSKVWKYVASRDFIQQMAISILTWNYWARFSLTKTTCWVGNGMSKKTSGYITN